jgi:pyridoxamine 5'-phosphate oxidase
MQDRIQELRKEYRKEVLDEAATHENPIIQFKKWFQEALDVQLNEPNAMMLATVNEHGRPSARIVLLKDITNVGITFYTNYLSRKGKEIAGQDYACVTFFWPELERQIRFEGKLSKVDVKISDDYFAIRPRGSQIGAWSSPQSQQIQSRAVLEENERKFIQQFEGKPVPRPEHWGGYQLEPDYVEFWQGRENRMHDRICYSLKEATWNRFRVAP